MSEVDKIAEAQAGGLSGVQLPAKLQPGDIFAEKFRIIASLGSGGMGEVFKAEQILLERLVAIKLLHPHLSQNESYLERFKREAKIASKIHHPNAITLHDFGIENGNAFLVMEYVEGKTLKQLLLDEGALSAERIDRLLQQFGSAINEAHSVEVIHRDLKPDNLMIHRDRNGNEVASVLDFGIAKIVGLVSDGSVAATQTGHFVGTPLYMSPEQVTGKPVNRQSDIYSCGVILYEMLTGEVPFSSNSPLEVMTKHLASIPIPPRELRGREGIAPEVSAVVMQALEKDPAARFKTMEELVSAFHAALEPRKAPSPIKASPKNLEVKFQPAGHKKLLRPLAGLAAAACAVGVLSLSFGDRKSSGAPSDAAPAAVAPDQIGRPSEAPPPSQTAAAEHQAELMPQKQKEIEPASPPDVQPEAASVQEGEMESLPDPKLAAAESGPAAVQAGDREAPAPPPEVSPGQSSSSTSLSGQGETVAPPAVVVTPPPPPPAPKKLSGAAAKKRSGEALPGRS